MNDPQQPRLTPLNERETEAVNAPDGDDYDTGLGLRMARDTIRVSNGEFSDEAFHEKCHEAVVAEFGEDAHPTEPEGSDE